MKIISLQSENIKRLKAVNISPNGDPLVVVGGRNAQGKTSVLDSIEYALGGKPKTSKPIRDGEKTARVVLETETLRVTRSFSDKGSYLTVEDMDGGKHGSPQSVLDKLYCALSFDPLEFSRKSPKEQAETLKELVGIDLTPLDNARKAAYDERTIVNREVKALEAQIEALPEIEEVKPVSVSNLLQERERRQEVNEINSSKRSAVQEVHGHITSIETEIVNIKEEIKRLDALLGEKKSELDLMVNQVQKAESEISELQDLDVDEITQQIADAETINAKASQSEKRNVLKQHLTEKRLEADKLTAKIKSIEEEKQLSIAEAKFPITGLAFDENGITYNGIPFEQSSSAEQLRVSVSMGLALNPELRVLLIRDGSLLDDESLSVISTMAKEADAQVWIERVSESGEGCTVVIEDGSILEREVE